MKNIVAVHHHAAQHGEFWNRRAHQTHVRAQAFAVKRLRLNRAATQHRVRQL
jgi:hypothetical protein